jgi:hypothetical protein
MLDARRSVKLQQLRQGPRTLKDPRPPRTLDVVAVEVEDALLQRLDDLLPADGQVLLPPAHRRLQLPLRLRHVPVVVLQVVLDLVHWYAGESLVQHGHRIRRALPGALVLSPPVAILGLGLRVRSRVAHAPQRHVSSNGALRAESDAICSKEEASMKRDSSG